MLKIHEFTDLTLTQPGRRIVLGKNISATAISMVAEGMYEGAWYDLRIWKNRAKSGEEANWQYIGQVRLDWEKIDMMGLAQYRRTSSEEWQASALNNMPQLQVQVRLKSAAHVLSVLDEMGEELQMPTTETYESLKYDPHGEEFIPPQISQIPQI
jgi:hypothetical protein